MFKTKTKLFIVLFVLFSLITTFCFAAEPITTSEGTDENSIVPSDTTPAVTNSESELTEEDSAESQQIHSDDLYLFGDNVVVDKIVDGNVYVMGSTVSVTGQIYGNLFVLAKDFSLNDAYVKNSIFLCASTASINGACSDLYAACDNLNVSYDSYIARDSRISCNTLTFKALNTRNMFVTASNIDFGSESEIATIYGNLEYTSNHELTLADGTVTGEVKYTPMEITNVKNSIDFIAILTSIVSTIIYSIVIYFIIRCLTPKFKESISEYASSKIIIAFLIGLVAIIIIPVISILLLLSSFTAGLSLALIAVYALFISITFTVFCLFITKLFSKKFAKIPEFGLFIIVTAILAVLAELPYISSILYVITLFSGFGMIIISLFKTIRTSFSTTIETTIVENSTDSNKE